jgi:thioester reductase-like protein
MKIFLTGSTGFLGGELLVLLSKDPRVEKIYCLVRAANDAGAEKRLSGVFAIHDDYFDHEKVVPFVGDLSNKYLPDALKKITEVDTVIHAAADTSFAPSHDENIQKTNIEGAGNVARWAAGLSDLKTFVYIGTSWICGCDRPNRLVTEDESPDMAVKHFVEYSRSKALGEINIRSIVPADKLLVVRPSIIMGDSRPWEPRSNVIKWVLAAADVLRLLPVNPEAKIDIIPVDYAAKSIVNLIFSKKRGFDTYHISSGDKSATNTALLVKAADFNSSIDRPPIRFVDYKMMEQMYIFSKKGKVTGLKKYPEYLEYWTKNLKDDLEQLLWALNFYCQYINLSLIFDNSRLLRDADIGLSEPAHEYIRRNKEHLKKIDVLSEDIDP